MARSVLLLLAVLGAAAAAACGAEHAHTASSVMDACAAAARAPKEEAFKRMLADAEAIEPEIIALRRELHRRPALMYEEYEAQALVMETLGELGVRASKTAITGVRAQLGAPDAATVMVLRGDMDALPILEEAEVDFRSEVDGVMHACGHDTHTAMLLGAAKLLKPYEAELAARGEAVRFAFQPAEEGGCGGKIMIDEGLLDGASAAFALHTASALDTGVVAGMPGVSMASASDFIIVVRGRGGHAAMPHDAVDPVNAAAQIVLSLNTVVGRMVDSPNDPVVVGVSTIHGGGASNIIPEEVVIEGTVRALSIETNGRVMDIVEARAMAIGAANGCSVHVDRQEDFVFTNSRGEEARGSTMTYPEMRSDPALFELAMLTATNLFKDDAGGSEAAALVRVHENPTMGAEDFAFFSKRVPSVMLNIGHRGEDPATGNNHHHPRFTVDEAMLHRGSALLAMTALEYLRSARAGGE